MTTTLTDTADSTAEQRTIAGLKQAILGIGYLRMKEMFSSKSLLAVSGVSMILILITFITVASGNAGQFQTWMFHLFALRFVPLMCLERAGGSLRNEIKDYTIEYLWTRSPKKSHLVIAEYISSVIVTAFRVFIFTTLIHATGMYLEITDIFSMFGRILMIELFAILAYSALAMLIGLLTGKYMILGVIYGLIVEIGISQVPLNLNKISVSHHLATMMGGPSSLAYTHAGANPFMGALGCTVIAAIGLGAACILFSNKQYRMGNEKES